MPGSVITILFGVLVLLFVAVMIILIMARAVARTFTTSHDEDHEMIEGNIM